MNKDDKNIIYNQIKKISNIKNYKITNDILFYFLAYNRRYGELNIAEEDIYEHLIKYYNYKINIDKITNSINILVDRNILIKNKDLDDTIRYNLNLKYFNDNDIW